MAQAEGAAATRPHHMSTPGRAGGGAFSCCAGRPNSHRSAEASEGVPPEPEPSRDVESLLPSLEEFLGSCKLSQYVGSLAGRELVSLFDADEAELRDAGLKQFHAKRFIRHRRELLASLELVLAPQPEPGTTEPETEQDEKKELWD